VKSKSIVHAGDGIELTAEEDAGDTRAKSRVVRFYIRNMSTETIRVDAVKLLPSPGISVERMSEPVHDERRERAANLRRGLSLILTDAVHYNFKTIEKKRLDGIRDFVIALSKDFAGIFGIYRLIFSTTLGRDALTKRIRKEWAERFHAPNIDIGSYADAERTVEILFPEGFPEPEKDIERVVRAKIDQLKELENHESNAGEEAEAIATLPPASRFSRSYVLNAPQYLLVLRM